MKSVLLFFDRWLWKMAWRDSRKNRSRLLLFISSIILGVAALVAINSFRENLKKDIDRQAKTVLGADLVLNNNQPLSDSIQWLIDSIGGQQAHERSFASMIYFPRTRDTRLVQVRALGGDFPFYGDIETEPQSASSQFRAGQKALVDHTLLLQFNANAGDSVKVGNLSFFIEGRIKKLPGQNGITATVAPPVYIPIKYLDQTGLQQKGSRIQYRYYIKLPEGTDVEALVENIRPRLRSEGVGVSTVASTKNDLGDAFDNLSKFLNLVAFVALLLGCVGVASAVHIYVREKLATVAILRCLGLKGIQALMIYLAQIATMGFIGAVIGAILGSIIQTSLPYVLQDFLPIDIETGISWTSILRGIGIGIFISLLFALIPLLGIRKVSPLLTLRASFDDSHAKSDRANWLVYLLIGIFIYTFAFWQTGGLLDALFFCIGLGVSFLLLTAVARLVMWAVRKYFPVSWSFTWRQGLANLYRPNNQTLILIISVGLGTALITTLYFTQSLLLDKVSLSSIDNQPNMVMFDIQSNQKTALNRLTSDYELPIIQEAPIVTMKLNAINGKTKARVEKDSLSDIPRWAFNREYRVTYRNYLIDSEKTVDGEWRGKVENPGDPIYISIDKGYSERMGVEIGDTLTFNVQGALFDTYVSHLREIEWNRVQTNFLVLFPEGVLEKAPQFHVIMTRTEQQNVSAKFQQAVVRNFPNVSVIDLGLILSTIDEILGKVSFVIQFMAMFSILTGFFVLISSVILSKYQRIQESVLLRTMGANRNQIMKITALEYFLLGSLASVTGIVISMISSWLLAYFSFDASFTPSILPVLGVYVIITSLTIIIGILNSSGILSKPPLEVLRKEI